MVRLSIAACSLLMFVSGAASALPGISLSEPPAEVGADECPLLIQIKYPWLGCKTDATGARSLTSATVAASASWDADRTIAIGHDWVEGEGAWRSR